MPRHSPLTLISLELSQVIYLEILKSKGTSAPLHSEEIGIVVVRLDARARYAILKNRKSNNAHCLGQRAGCCSLKRHLQLIRRADWQVANRKDLK